MRILCWNRDDEYAWPIDDYLKLKIEIEVTARPQRGKWSVGRHRDIQVGEAVYMLVQGNKHPRGVVGRGIVRSTPYPGAHWKLRGKTTNYIDIDWLELTDPDAPLSSNSLSKIKGVDWLYAFQNSGNRVPVKAEGQLAEYWEAHYLAANSTNRLTEAWFAGHGKKQIEFANRLWPLLVSIAHRNDIVTYSDISASSGISVRWIGRGLGPIQDYCDYHGLPPLTVLVVNAQTRLPGRGSRYRSTFHEQLKRFHELDWRSLANPFAEDTDLLENLVVREILNKKSLTPTRKQQLITARVGQGKFREETLAHSPACVVTGVSDPRLLIASHIRPWAKCENDKQRLDPNNGLMLTPDVDKLFDSGLITFENDGRVRVSKDLSKETLKRLGLKLPLKVKAFARARHDYLKYHREQQFEKSHYRDWS